MQRCTCSERTVRSCRNAAILSQNTHASCIHGACHVPSSARVCSACKLQRVVHSKAMVPLQEFSKVFKPHACELNPWNASHFEQCLKGRRVIIIGDSTMRQTFQSLACLMTDRIKDGFFLVCLYGSAQCTPTSCHLKSKTAQHTCKEKSCSCLHDALRRCYSSRA